VYNHNPMISTEIWIGLFIAFFLITLAGIIVIASGIEKNGDEPKR